MVISAKLQINERNACCPCMRVNEDNDNIRQSSTNKNETLSVEAKLEEKGKFKNQIGIFGSGHLSLV